jgi:spore coat polysaccharide biosynthesis protein SpsF (cytidylyltransferase family)
MTLDYPEDLEFFRSIISKSEQDNKYLYLDDILHIIDSNPELKKINYFRQKEFLLNQKINNNLKLKKDYQ